jgi:hypothetical protein
MDRVILLNFGGSVSKQFELVGMRPHMLTFEKLTSLNELVARVRAVMNVGCDLRLYGRYDMESNRPIYVMLPLGHAYDVARSPPVWRLEHAPPL